MAEGYIQKALSGFYYIYSEGEIYQTRARGIFRNRNITPLVGDKVKFTSANKKEGVLEEVFPRTNALERPPVANVEIGLIIMSLVEPDFSQQLLDRFLVHLSYHKIHPVIIVTKTDLATDEQVKHVEEIVAYYKKIDYPVLMTSSVADVTDSEQAFFTGILKDRVSVFTGQSGAGKSALLNKLSPTLELKTGEISQSLGRGRHTTRHVELLPIFGGLVADTPGFSSLAFNEIEVEELPRLYPDFQAIADDCKFKGCMHHHEPKCAVKDQVEQGIIPVERYQNYLMFLSEIQKRKPKY